MRDGKRPHAPSRPLAALALIGLAAACQGPHPARAPAGGARPDPAEGAVPLPSTADDWRAFLVYDGGGVGVWTVEALDLFPHYGALDVVGLDDRGRCLVFVSYSGRWIPLPTFEDGKWLGALALGDVDPRVAGSELYVGGRAGRLDQVRPYPDSGLDFRRIAAFPGRELHALAAVDLDPVREGTELFAFVRPGEFYEVTPTGPAGGFETRRLGATAGRVRDTVLLPGEPALATVSRGGVVAILRLAGGEPVWEEVYRESCGLGRIDARPPELGPERVLYTVTDDGRALRHERAADGSWRTETIFVGPLGARGIAAGRFDADPTKETLAVFGYSGEVVQLTREGDGWRARTLFAGPDKGHWLAAAELDGRNATRELLASGYDGRIVLLARPAGYGLAGAGSSTPQHTPEGSTRE